MKLIATCEREDLRFVKDKMVHEDLKTIQEGINLERERYRKLERVGGRRLGLLSFNYLFFSFLFF